MLYNRESFPNYVQTAGKITIVTAVTGLLVFVVAFMLDVGKQEFNRVSAQFATTTLTVLNTPPQFSLNAFEVPDSSTSSPTNSGDVQQWQAIGTDSNSAPYFLLICSTNATPTANAAADSSSLGTAPPACSSTSTVQWGVSASTTSGAIATVSTTTVEGSLFNEVNEWFAWVCDDDPFNPRCNTVAVQGPTSTSASSSPFHMNNRPTFFNLSNDAPVDPGGSVTWTSVSDDSDIVGGADTLTLVVCQSTSTYNTVTNNCTDQLATSTFLGTSNATATYALAAIVRDDTYPAYGFIFDEHGHEATSSPLQADFVVNNVAPTVLGGDITLNGGSDIVLDNPGGESITQYTLDFKIRDANSCVNAASSSEITGFNVSVFRADLNSTTTCSGAAGDYNPNNCYPNGVASTTWNLSCTATTTCAGPTQDDIDYSCTFPLWFLADPTDAGPETPTAFANDVWTAAVAGVDDQNASGSLATTTNSVELISFSAIDILAANIAYPGTAPGDDTGATNATSTALNVGNTGLDQEVQGTSMCGTYSPTTTCPVSATSTIPADQQQFASSTFSYGAAFALTLSSTTDTELELDILKTTSTAQVNFQTGTTYWGIAVPVAITVAGNYTGLNTFTARTAEAVDWE